MKRSSRHPECCQGIRNCRFGARAYRCLTEYWAFTSLTFLVLVIAMSTPNIVHAQDSQVLLHRYRCYVCHADAEALAGPAYVDVAAKYKGKPQALATISAVIKNGARRGGPWHMPPHPEVSDAEAMVMARYILSIKAEVADHRER